MPSVNISAAQVNVHVSRIRELWWTRFDLAETREYVSRLGVTELASPRLAAEAASFYDEIGDYRSASQCVKKSQLTALLRDDDSLLDTSIARLAALSVRMELRRQPTFQEGAQLLNRLKSVYVEGIDPLLAQTHRPNVAEIRRESQAWAQTPLSMVDISEERLLLEAQICLLQTNAASELQGFLPTDGLMDRLSLRYQRTCQLLATRQGTAANLFEAHWIATTYQPGLLGNPQDTMNFFVAAAQRIPEQTISQVFITLTCARAVKFNGTTLAQNIVSSCGPVFGSLMSAVGVKWAEFEEYECWRGQPDRLQRFINFADQFRTLGHFHLYWEAAKRAVREIWQAPGEQQQFRNLAADIRATLLEVEDKATSDCLSTYYWDNVLFSQPETPATLRAAAGELRPLVEIAQQQTPAMRHSLLLTLSTFYLRLGDYDETVTLREQAFDAEYARNNYETRSLTLHYLAEARHNQVERILGQNVTQGLTQAVMQHWYNQILRQMEVLAEYARTDGQRGCQELRQGKVRDLIRYHNTVRLRYPTYIYQQHTQQWHHWLRETLAAPLGGPAADGVAMDIADLFLPL